MTRNDERRPQLSPEEIAIFKDCETAVTIKKCIPLALGLATVSELLYKSGYHTRRGRGVFGAILVGFIGGKVFNSMSEGSCFLKVVKEVPDGAVAQSYYKKKQRRNENSSEMFGKSWNENEGLPSSTEGTDQQSFGESRNYEPFQDYKNIEKQEIEMGSNQSPAWNLPDSSKGTQESSPPQGREGRKVNKYGDVWDE